MDHSNSAATMDNMINCAACLNIFNIPLCLPCNHHYCLNCLRLFTKVKGKIRCQISVTVSPIFPFGDLSAPRASLRPLALVMLTRDAVRACGTDDVICKQQLPGP